MGTVRQRVIQVAGDGGGDHFPGAGNNLGKLRIVWVIGGGFFPETSHGTVPWDQLTSDEGV